MIYRYVPSRNSTMGFAKDRQPGNDNDEYVKASDYNALKERVEQLEAALRKALDLIEAWSNGPLFKNAGVIWPEGGCQAPALIDGRKLLALTASKPACQHPMNFVNHHGFVSDNPLDFRCTVCNTILRYTPAEAAEWEKQR